MSSHRRESNSAFPGAAAAGTSLPRQTTFPFEDSEQQIETLATANARAGLRYEVAPTFMIGGGWYADPKNFTQTGLNYYGLTLGGELSTPYETVQKGDVTFDP